jgi:hypothetical protein
MLRLPSFSQEVVNKATNVLELAKEWRHGTYEDMKEGVIWKAIMHDTISLGC